jgi:hypothetical protein
VLTRDNGFRTVRWTGSRTIDGRTLATRPELRPVCIRRDAFGPGLPERDMMVSPQHRMLLTGSDVQLHTGETEVLACAKHLAPQSLRQVGPLSEVTYLHILFDGHELVRADGCWTESFQPAARTTDAMDEAVRDELLAIFPQLATSEAPVFEAARMTLKPWETKVITR